MKATYDRVSSDIFLKIDTDRAYKDEYKTHMINENNIPGIIPYYVQKTKEGSSYSYNVSGMISMKNKFLDRSIGKEDMDFFVKSLFDTAKSSKKYMLDANEILLYPELIFWDKDKWKFLYFPFKSKGFENGFLRIQDFFVKRINNEDMDGIIFFHKLHKSSLIDPFSMDNIISATKEREKKETILEVPKKDNIYNIEEKEIKMVCEKPEDKSILGHYKRNKKSADKKNKWGSFQ